MGTFLDNMDGAAFFVTGASFKSASLDILEALSRGLGPGMSEAMEKAEQEAGAFDEIGILSTCNRVEIYGVCQNGQGERLRDFLRRLSAAPEGAVYFKQEEGALRHLFNVVSGLDSMVLGEAEILGQVKTAYEQARRAGRTKSILNTTFQRALFVGKMVRTQTQIAHGRLSVASVALELAGKIFSDFSKLHVAVAGAGVMGLETAKRLLEARPRRKTFLSRTFERAQALAQEFGGEAGTFEELPQILAGADIILFQAKSPKPLVEPEMALSARGQGAKNCFLIDMAVPRNVDEACSRLPGVFLYNIDDLKSIAQSNYEKRRQEVNKAEQIIADEVQKFSPQYHSRLAPAPAGLLQLKRAEAFVRTSDIT